MEFTKEKFVAFCRKIVSNGMSLNLTICGGGIGFGYFEIKPYANESTIKYNITRISNTENKIFIYCSARIQNFDIGETIVEEETFMRYAKEIRLFGNFDKRIIDIYESL